MIELRRYVTPTGVDVVGEWLAKLKDDRARAKIVIRLDRVSAATLLTASHSVKACGNSALIGVRVTAFTMPWWAGNASCSWRAAINAEAADIERAIAHLKDYKERAQEI